MVRLQKFIFVKHYENRTLQEDIKLYQSGVRLDNRKVFCANSYLTIVFCSLFFFRKSMFLKEFDYQKPIY